MSAREPVERARIRFAWIPVRCDDGRWLWWRSYVHTQGVEADHGGWSAGVWTTTSRVALTELTDPRPARRRSHAKV